MVPSSEIPPRCPRVLLLAEQCNPEWTSGPLVGWSLGRALLPRVDGHLVTHVRNRENLEKAGWREGREFTSLDTRAVERPLFGFGEAVRRITRLGPSWTTALGTVSYYAFEVLVWRRYGAEIGSGRWDLVHRLTPVSPAVPSPLAARCRRRGVPFVWGPINGGIPWPREFRHALRKEGEWLSYLRGARKLLPAYRSSRRDAAALLVGSTPLWNELRAHHDRAVYLPENAVDPSVFGGPAASSSSGGPLRVAFAGRLVALKGVDMLVEAAAPLLRSGRLALEIIGDGPELPVLRRQLEELGVAARVTLPGWVNQGELSERLRRAQVFAFPSIREFGGGAILEAMALGLVPVVVASGGPGELVTEETGFRVSLGSREAIVAGFRRALETLLARPDEVARMGQRARARVERLFTWEVKAAQILEVYRWVLGERSKPDFGMPLREPPEELTSGDSSVPPADRSGRPSPAASPGAGSPTGTVAGTV